MMKISAQAKNALLLVNPVSGTGDGKMRTAEMVRLAEKYGWKGEVVETTKKIGADSLARKALKKGIKHIIVCGGDGTIMEVLGVIFQKPVSIGVVPLGTGNLFARNLHIPLDIDKAMGIALSGKKEAIDIGTANGTFFSIIAGIGLDAQTMRDAKRSLKDVIGFGAYIISALKNVTKRSGTYRITIDGKRTNVYKAKSVMVANMGKIQGGVELVPRAKPQSGLLKIGIIKANTFFSWISIFFYALRQRVSESKHYELFVGRQVTIESLSGLQVYQCDGNEFPATKKLEITIYPKSIIVLT